MDLPAERRSTPNIRIDAESPSSIRPAPPVAAGIHLAKVEGWQNRLRRATRRAAGGGAMDISTRYLGLRLAHPFMMGASPLALHLDTVRRLEDGGASAIVLHSLFEEQITMADEGQIHHMDPWNREFASLLAEFPSPERLSTSPTEYLELLRKVKDAVGIPVIASLNAMTTETWMEFAKLVPDAGADALELNVYAIAADPTTASASVEGRIVAALAEVKRLIHIPVAVKLLPFFTTFGQFARRLDVAGADGLVLFNRFYAPDVDVAALTVVPRITLSTSAELPLRLHWVSLLHGRLRASLAITGGIAMPGDGVKAILAGAHAVQLVTAILRHGPAYFGVMREGLLRWMEARPFTSIEEVRGRVAIEPAADPELVERARYIRTLQSWSGGLGSD
jgi:dihydroorotate dehydrogenase (fumarate)